MLTEKELNECLKEDIENMEDDNIVNELAYYAYSYGKDGYKPRYEIIAGKCSIEAGGDCPLRSKGRYIDLDLAKKVIAKFEGYLDDDMIARIQIALEKECEAANGNNNSDT